MWLCTQFGFFSIVQKPRMEIHVRARFKRDLENLRKLCGKIPDWRILRTEPADYRWRLIVRPDDLALILSCLGEAIDYPNFKSRIHNLPDQEEKSSAYAVLWAGLHALQK